MIKRIVIEKIISLFILVLFAIIGGYNILAMEREGVLSEDPMQIKFILGIIFIMIFIFLISNRNIVHLNKFFILLFFMFCYIALMRIAIIPNTASKLSYFYQPLNSIIVPFIFLFTYTLTIKSEKLKEFISTCTIIPMLIIVYYYIKNYNFINIDNGQSHLISAYWVLFILPLLLFTSKEWLKNIGIAIAGAVVFSSIKRGGIFAFAVGLIGYFFVKEFLFNKQIKKFFLFFCITILFLSVFYYIDSSLDNILYERFSNIGEDKGSGRIQVWDITLKMITESNNFSLLLGHGHNMVVKNSPLQLSAHNDFLETLYDYGIIGFTFYLILHIMLIKQIFRGVRKRNPDTAIMVFTYSIFIVLSSISHIIIYPWMMFLPLTWGIFYADERKYN